MDRLKRRADFLATATGSKAPAGAFVLLAQPRPDQRAARVGFTVTKKTGNAVERNRIRRRLRELVRLASMDALKTGHDYVLIGRRSALSAPFDRLNDDLARALTRVHAQKK
jgi:ribonuclease P protein component